MTWTQQSLERVLRVELSWRRVKDALAQSQARLQSSQTLLDTMGADLQKRDLHRRDQDEG
jgi:hypothetical protein